MAYSIQVKGIHGIEKYLESIPKAVEQASREAVDSATKYAFVLGKREIQLQVNLPDKYLSGSESGEPRFYIAKRPSRSDTTGIVRGRVRGTSLHRFLVSDKGQGLLVKVKSRGKSVRMRRAFSIKLKNGNRGIALRLPSTEKPLSTGAKLYGTKANTAKTNLWLLYGPSVQQVFKDVAPDIAPKVSEYLNSEFNRKIARML